MIRRGQKYKDINGHYPGFIVEVVGLPMEDDVLTCLVYYDQSTGVHLGGTFERHYKESFGVDIKGMNQNVDVIRMDFLEDPERYELIFDPIPRLTMAFNTCRRYTNFGQRIGVVQDDTGKIVFADIDRMIYGEINLAGGKPAYNIKQLKSIVFEAYDYNMYKNVNHLVDEDVKQAIELANKAPVI